MSIPLEIAAFFGLGMVIGMVLRRTSLVELCAERGHSKYGGIGLLIGIATALFAAFITLTIIFDWGGARTESPSWPLGAVMALIFGIIAIAMLWYWRLVSWTWDADGIAYSGMKGVTRIRWREIKGVDYEAPYSWRIESSALRMYVSRYTLGYTAIFDAIRLYRPDLAAPDVRGLLTRVKL